MDIRKYPYCSYQWADIIADMDFSNLSVMDKILLLTKDMYDLHINSFQCGRDVVALNKVFGLKEGVKNSDYGVQSMWLAGYDYGMSARIPRIHIEYLKNGWWDNNVVYIGEHYLPKNYRYDKYRVGTDAEIEGVYNFLRDLVEKRKREIEDARKLPSLDEFAKLCYDYVNECIVTKNDVTCALKYGKTQVEKEKYNAVVIYGGEQCTENQIGHIGLGKNEYGELSLSCNAPLCGSYSVKLTALDEYKDIVKSMVNYLVN